MLLTDDQWETVRAVARSACFRIIDDLHRAPTDQEIDQILRVTIGAVYRLNHERAPSLRVQ